MEMEFELREELEKLTACDVYRSLNYKQRFSNIVDPLCLAEQNGMNIDVAWSMGKTSKMGKTEKMGEDGKMGKMGQMRTMRWVFVGQSENTQEEDNVTIADVTTRLLAIIGTLFSI